MIKKLLIIALISQFVSCGKREQISDNMRMTIEVEPISITKDTAIINRRQKMIDHELDYYMKRHTVDEEGFGMVVNYATRGNTILGDYLRPGKPHLIGMLSLRNIRRQGFGIQRDQKKRLCLGTWHQDTLTTGMRMDARGLYAGQFDKRMKPSGHGCYSAFDGSFYEGHWTGGKKVGFGMKVSTQNLLTGIWRNDSFFGERMRHTSERIYGIDISRYQHGGTGINWNELKIKNLGKHIQDNISGEVDYPVRFAYIKSTQGTTIRNRYLLSDYRAAQKRKIPVGAYHFFSTKKKGREQAVYFANNTLFKKGDLPPALDIEPSNKQIAKMGGTAVFIREIRAWISYIEQRLHVKPILYVNQRIIEEHLMQDPDLLKNYTIWIARYGEYKPGIHLSIWQVSQDALVKGIKGHVDVNVFNGFEPQWEEFLRKETIQK